MAMDYKRAGVDIEAGYRSVELMKELSLIHISCRQGAGDRNGRDLDRGGRH